MPQPPPREATGDGEEGGVASRESMRLANHNGYSGTAQSVPPECSCRLDPGPMWQYDDEISGLDACLRSGFEAFFDNVLWL
jgi:hypothetical protein